MKRTFRLIIIFFIFSFLSCENNLELEDNLSNQNNISDKIELIDGTIKINSKNALKNMINDYKKDVKGQNEFNVKIKDLQDKGFKPLTPIFDENDTKKIEDFYIAKKQILEKRNREYGIISRSTTSDEDVDFDDDLISDPALAALLNEDKEIVVSDSLYKYTETGLYFCLVKDKNKLYNYLNKLSLSSKKSRINSRISPCLEMNQASFTTYDQVMEVSDGINYYIPPPAEDCYLNYPTPAPAPIPAPTPAPLSIVTPMLIKQDLPISRIEKQGWLEKIFGETEVDTEDYGDGRRIKVKFWNQNYFIFSSLGCSARFQKRVKILGIAGWQKSYATQIELGVNSIEYTYNFNVPAFNAAQYEYNTVFFESNGVKFNQNGKIITKMPTGSSNFIFNTEYPEDALNITICNDILTLLNAKEANKLIDELAKRAVKALPGMTEKYLLENKIANGKIKYNVIIASPLDNKVTFKTMGVRWVSNDDNAITHYFDFNFLLTYKSTYVGAEDYLKGLQGSKKYNTINADIYGAALHNNVWKGRRLILEK